MLKKYLLFLLAFAFQISSAQIYKEILPPYNIKTVTFVQNGLNTIPVFKLGDGFQLQFDDLFGNEANYYYTITHCDYDWKPSQLVKNEYIQGFDDQRIQNYLNSFNTLQIYSHYILSFPNKFTSFRVSGNYILKILNEDKEVVFTRKFILYEDLVQVPMQVKRARNVNVIASRQNLDFAVKSADILFQSPLQNVKILLMKNGQLNDAITNVKPQYTIGNDLIYKYDTETQFFGGNEFNFFENKDVRAATFGVGKVDSQGGIYNAYLYTQNARRGQPYTYLPDNNGNFFIRVLNAENKDIEADYVWVFFRLSAPAYFGKADIYVNGMFNNYALSPENKMDYIADKGIYEKAIMIKQGYTNYQFQLADKAGNINHFDAIDGNFYETENDYVALVYYRENNQRYDRVIGRGAATSVNIIN